MQLAPSRQDGTPAAYILELMLWATAQVWQELSGTGLAEGVRSRESFKDWAGKAGPRQQQLQLGKTQQAPFCSEVFGAAQLGLASINMQISAAMAMPLHMQITVGTIVEKTCTGTWTWSRCS